MHLTELLWVYVMKIRTWQKNKAKVIWANGKTQHSHRDEPNTGWRVKLFKVDQGFSDISQVLLLKKNTILSPRPQSLK